MTLFKSTLRSRRFLATAFLASALSAGLSVSANANMACGPHEKLIKTLTGKYKELRKGIGLVASQKVAEVYVSETGSWTFIVTHVTGISCIVATGHSWEEGTQTASVEPGI